MVEFASDVTTITGYTGVGTFPDYRSLIPATGMNEASMNWEDLNALIRGGSVFQSAWLALLFSKEGGTCSVFGSNEELGSYDGLVRKATVENDMRSAFDPKYLIQMMDSCKNDDLVTIRFVSESSVAMFDAIGNDWGFTALLMPMFVSWEKVEAKAEAIRTG